jgi:hypothetical protein
MHLLLFVLGAAVEQCSAKRVETVEQLVGRSKRTRHTQSHHPILGGAPLKEQETSIFSL